jgi:hypothetical protein
MDRVMCATYRFRNGGKSRGVRFIEAMREVDSVTASDIGEFPVFVGIGDFPENSCPSTSTVRLQPIDSGYMCGVDAFEPTSINPMAETFLVSSIGNCVPL